MGVAASDQLLFLYVLECEICFTHCFVHLYHLCQRLADWTGGKDRR